MKWIVFLLGVTTAFAQPPKFQQTSVSVGCQPLDVLTHLTDDLQFAGGTIGPGRTVVYGDFNGDKRLDLAFLCSGQISVLLGNGDGTFQAPIVNSIPVSGSDLVAADLNGDGNADLLVGDESTKELLVLISSGDGHFQAPTVYKQVVRDPDGFVVGDFTGDGIPDVLFGNQFYAFLTSGSVQDDLFFLMPGKNDGSLGTPEVIPSPAFFTSTPYNPTSIVVADFNGDGVLDFIGLLPDDVGGFAGELFLGNKAQPGTFIIPTKSVFSDTGTVLSVVTGDFNGDRKPDVALVPNNSKGIGFVYGGLGEGDGTFQSQTTTSIPFGGAFAVGDLDGDGKSDLAEVSGQHGLSILISKGDGRFTVSSLPISGMNPTGVIVADLNGDGKLDIVTANSDSGDATVLLNSVSSASASAVVNGASFAPAQPVSPGSLGTLFGTGFVTTDAVAGSIPLPMTLGGVSVTIGGVPAPLLGVYKNQINLQVPWTVPAGSAQVVVTVNGTALAPIQAMIASIAPGIFTTQSGTGQAVAINPDNSLADPAHPAKAGEALVILATGLGPVTPADGDGVASLDAERKSTTLPTVLIGGESAQVAFAGLSPQFVGVNQINVIVPKVATSGVVALQIKSGGIETTDKVTIAVAH